MKSFSRLLFAFAASFAVTAPTLGAASPSSFSSVVSSVNAAAAPGGVASVKSQAESALLREAAGRAKALKPAFKAAYDRRDAALVAPQFQLTEYQKAEEEISALFERRQIILRDEVVRLAKGASVEERKQLLKQFNQLGKKKKKKKQQADVSAQVPAAGSSPFAASAETVSSAPANTASLQPSGVTPPASSVSGPGTVQPGGEPVYYNEIRGTLRDIRARARAGVQEYRSAVRARAEALTAPVFDAEAYIKADQKVAELNRARSQERGKAISDLAAKYDRTQRQALAGFLHGPAPKLFR